MRWSSDKRLSTSHSSFAGADTHGSPIGRGAPIGARLATVGPAPRTPRRSCPARPPPPRRCFPAAWTPGAPSRRTRPGTAHRVARRAHPSPDPARPSPPRSPSSPTAKDSPEVLHPEPRNLADRYEPSLGPPGPVTDAAAPAVTREDRQTSSEDEGVGHALKRHLHQLSRPRLRSGCGLGAAAVTPTEEEQR